MLDIDKTILKEKMKAFELENNIRVKMVGIIRTDLNMTCGKIVAQVGHAYVKVSDQFKFLNRRAWDEWNRNGHIKVSLRIDSEVKMLELEKEFKEMKNKKQLKYPVAFSKIIDEGITEIEPDALTAMAFMGHSDDLNKITGTLELL